MEDMPPLAELDALAPGIGGSADEPDSRSASHSLLYNFGANSAVAQSVNAQNDGSYMRLFAGGGRMEWAVFRLDFYGVPEIHTEIHYTEDAGAPYLAFANYGKGYWEIVDPGSGYQVVYRKSLGDLAYASPDGYRYYAVLAYDGTDVRCGQAKALLLPGQYAKGDVLPLAPGLSHLDLVELDGRPAITFYDDAAQQLRLLRADSDKPAFPDAWESSVLSDLPQAGRLHDSLASADGALLVAYTVGNYEQLRFSSYDEPGQSAGPGGLDESVYAGTAYFPKLAQSGGLIHLAFVAGDPGDANSDGYYGQLMHASRPLSGGSWTLTPLRNLPGMLPLEPSIAIIDGRPAVAAASGAGYELEFFIAETSAPEQYGDWQLNSLDLPVSRLDVTLIESGGAPQIWARAYGADATLHILRGTVGGAAVSWLPAAPAASISEGSLDAVDNAGRPAWMFWNHIDPNTALMVVNRAYRGDFTYGMWHGETLDFVDSGAGLASPGMAMVNGKPGCAWIHRNADGTRLIRYGWLYFEQ